MSKQRHDKGWNKRNRRQRPVGPVTGAQWLAHQLVDRGIADPVILGKIPQQPGPSDGIQEAS